MNQTLPFRTLQTMSNPDLTAALMSLGAAIAPTRNFRGVTPHDSQPIPGGPARALYIGGAGDVTAVNETGTAVTFTAVPAGTLIPIETLQVKSTNTTATGIVAL